MDHVARDSDLAARLEVVHRPLEARRSCHGFDSAMPIDDVYWRIVLLWAAEPRIEGKLGAVLAPKLALDVQSEQIGHK